MNVHNIFEVHNKLAQQQMRDFQTKIAPKLLPTQRYFAHVLFLIQ